MDYLKEKQLKHLFKLKKNPKGEQALNSYYKKKHNK